MSKISRTSANQACVNIGDVKVDSLLFVHDIARLSTSEISLQSALDQFNKVYSEYGMKINEKKTEVTAISMEDKRTNLRLNKNQLNQVNKFNYLRVQFSIDGKQDGEIDQRIAAVSGVLRSLYHIVSTKAELSKRAKITIFEPMYRTTLIYGHEHWVVTEKQRSRIQAAEMRFLHRISGLTLRDKICSTYIRESLQIEPLRQNIEQSQLRCLGHVIRMQRNRLPYQIFEAKPIGKRPIERPRTSWRRFMEKLSRRRLNHQWPEVELAATDRIRWKQILNALTLQSARVMLRK